MKIGAKYSEKGICEFTVWSPFAKDVTLKLLSSPERLFPMKRDESGYWNTEVDNVHPGTLYLYDLDGEKQRPDPASFCQPQGVHKASAIIDHNAFQWEDDRWKGITLYEMIIYELHIGTFTEGGTFGDIVPLLDELKEIGITAIELMPVAQFPGKRNWGYDGVYPFAVQNSYGGPDELKHLVNECHAREIAVVLDVVYNHLGPEGNYFWDYGPYFTDSYKTPWGQAINFDGPYSGGVRDFFIENALYWFEVYHIDALRLDAVHGIFDMSARPFLLELAEEVKDFSEKSGRKHHLIAESDLNDSVIVNAIERGGYGLDASWCDDFHHSLHALITGESRGYYRDFGGLVHLEKSIREGFVYSGQFSEFRKKTHGNSSLEIPAERFVVCSQNHDQVGNRMKGERLSSLVSFDALKLAAASVILSPFVPLLFMGEEYGETAPFLFFIDHSDPGLIKGVREGRLAEFRKFNWEEEPPDPDDIKTFMESRLNRELRNLGNHKVLREFYMELIRLRNELPPLSNLDKNCLDCHSDENDKTLFIRRWKENDQALIMINYNKSDVNAGALNSEIKWKKVLDSSDKRWNGPGSQLPEQILLNDEITLRAESCALYVKDD
ncbi:MAG: malto-oligosyltrehalose trehalohydrolase [Nitrospirota bacterium]